MSVRCRLSDFLRSRNESQIEFAERVGLSRQTIQKLYNNQMSGIEFTTLEKICRGLGINIGELLVMQETKLEQYLKHPKEVAIVLGANVFRRSGRHSILLMGSLHMTLRRLPASVRRLANSHHRDA